MKLDEIKLPGLKPRNPNQGVLAAKRNAGGPMRDKKQEQKRGEEKHRKPVLPVQMLIPAKGHAEYMPRELE